VNSGTLTLVMVDWPNDVREAVGAAHRALVRTCEARDAIYTAELAAICAIPISLW